MPCGAIPNNRTSCTPCWRTAFRLQRRRHSVANEIDRLLHARGPLRHAGAGERDGPAEMRTRTQNGLPDETGLTRRLSPAGPRRARRGLHVCRVVKAASAFALRKVAAAPENPVPARTQKQWCAADRTKWCIEIVNLGRLLAQVERHGASLACSARGSGTDSNLERMRRKTDSAWRRSTRSAWRWKVSRGSLARPGSGLR